MLSSIPTVTTSDLAGAVAADPATTVIDVREPHEFAAGHLPGALSIPMSVLPVRVEEIPRDRTVYVVCAVGARSGQVVSWLNEQGWDTVNVAGGTQDWIAAGRALEH